MLRSLKSLSFLVVCSSFLLAIVFSRTDPAAAHRSSHSRIDQLNFQLALAPESADLHLKRSELFLQVQHWSEARADVLRAAALDPANTEVPWLLARVELAAGAPDTALQLLDPFLADSPSHLRALILRAQVHRALRAPLAAARDYEAALEVSPDAGPTFYLELADTYAEASPVRLEEALAVLERGLVNVGSLLSLESRAVRLEIDLERFDSGLARVDRILTRHPQAWNWLATRADLLTRLGKVDEARATKIHVLELLEADPDRLQKSAARRELASDLRLELAQSESIQPGLAGADSTGRHAGPRPDVTDKRTATRGAVK